MFRLKQEVGKRIQVIENEHREFCQWLTECWGSAEPRVG